MVFSSHGLASPSNFDVKVPATTPSANGIQLDVVPWQAPNYLNQATALGYSAKDFMVSPEISDRVLFWTQIYGRFSSKQGVLHDRYDLRLIYAELDFSEIEDNPALTRAQVEAKKERLIRQKREEIYGTLHKLANVKSAQELSKEERRIWNLFPENNRIERIKKATDRDYIRFQLGQSDFFLKGIYYSGRYIRQMERIFREEGLPVELTRLPFVESSFNIFARSKVGASGIWQFMRGTGRDYMKIDKYVDERNDPLAASRSAARLLKNNYRELLNWPAAITAYNHGPSGIKRLMKEHQTNSLYELIDKVETSTFSFASKNFYACFLAALEVEAHADKYFTRPVMAPELPFETFVLPKAASYKSLIRIFDGDTMKAELLNPQFTSLVKRGALLMPKGSKLRIPFQKTAEYTELLKGPLAKEMLTVSAAAGNPYRVASGDSLSSIAQTFGTSVKSIMDLNSLQNPHSLRPGQTILIPAND